ncbi:MAG TPA: ABC transporter substrate-binding protein [Streptosporangiaceae bacterium]|nr:ABC transporter substrate-binding protein [Streptosporangiaceae bacterium]
MGGTLHIVANAGPDHIDTVPAYYTADYMLERAYTRQLLAYPTVPAPSVTSAGWTKDVTPVPDIATVVPTAANGGITNGGMTYTFHIKPGVMWDSMPPRQVTAADFIREFKAFFNPVSPVGNPGYYESTIAGLTSYATAETAFFASKANKPTAANIASFQNSHNITGITAPDSSTLQITLTQPASDFLYMMAMPFTSARPMEYDAYVPNSLQLDTHTLSDGPYKITSYVPGKSITMVRNSAWKQSTDQVRHDYVASIVVTDGVSSAATQLTDMQAGSQDLPIDTSINPPSIPGLLSSKTPQFHIWAWSDTFPYIVFNLRSPDAGGAMGKALVRQAVEYGVNKVEAAKVYGGPEVTHIINTVIPPGNTGYVNYNLYPDGNGIGNAAMCKSDLAKAGYPNGLTLIYTYPNDSVNTDEFAAIQASLKQCNITLTGKPEVSSSFFVDLGNSPENAKPNTWDMGQPGWIPDWFGNNGRTVIQALFQGPNCVVNTVNYGCYNSSTLNSLITKAEGATSLTTAGSFWHQADMQIMKDAVIVPLGSQGFPLYASKRVMPAGGLFAPNIGDADITNIWLSNG